MILHTLKSHEYSTEIIKLTIGMEREWIASNCFITFITFANSLKPGETPSNSASHQASDYLPPLLECIRPDGYTVVKVGTRTGMEWSGSGKNVNLISFSTVYK